MSKRKTLVALTIAILALIVVVSLLVRGRPWPVQDGGVYDIDDTRTLGYAGEDRPAR